MHLALFKKIRILYGLIHLVTHCQCSKLPWSSPNLVKITTIVYHMTRVISPNFLKKCQIQPISQDQWQIVKFIFEFKSTHATGIIFDGIKIGWILFTIKRFVPQCVKGFFKNNNFYGNFTAVLSYYKFGISYFKVVQPG